MRSELRKNARFEDFGKVECPEICVVTGILDDISLDGCKVHFDAPIILSLEDDYELHVRFSRFPQEVLTLMAHPQWTKEEGNMNSVGFAILRSPDTAKLDSYINKLKEEEDTPLDADMLPEESSCLFV